MKVRFKQNIASIYGGFHIGQEAELPDEAAKDYVAAGYADPVEAEKPKRARKPKPEEAEER